MIGSCWITCDSEEGRREREDVEGEVEKRGGGERQKRGLEGGLEGGVEERKGRREGWRRGVKEKGKRGTDLMDMVVRPFLTPLPQGPSRETFQPETPL